MKGPPPSLPSSYEWGRQLRRVVAVGLVGALVAGIDLVLSGWPQAQSGCGDRCPSVQGWILLWTILLLPTALVVAGVPVTQRKGRVPIWTAVLLSAMTAAGLTVAFLWVGGSPEVAPADFELHEFWGFTVLEGCLIWFILCLPGCFARAVVNRRRGTTRIPQRPDPAD